MSGARGEQRWPSGRWSPERAAAFFDPAFASPAATRQVRAILDQARLTPRTEPSTVVLEPALRATCSLHHRVAPLIERGWPSSAHGDPRLRSVGQLQLRAVASEVAELLRAAGIDCRVLKGLGTGPLDHAAARFRQTGDVDLLVAADDFAEAERLLLDRGCRPNGLERLPSTMLKGPTLIDPTGVEIDLHFRLEPLVPMPPAGVLMADPVPIGAGLTAPPAELRLLHAALHAVASAPGHRRLSSVSDIVAIIDNTGVDWDRARTLTDALQLTEFVAEALRLEAALMERDPHPGLDWPQLPGWKSRAILSDKRHMPTRHALMLANLPPGQRRLLYVYRWLFPEADFMERRHGLVGHFSAMWAGLRA